MVVHNPKDEIHCSVALCVSSRPCEVALVRRLLGQHRGLTQPEATWLDLGAQELSGLGPQSLVDEMVIASAAVLGKCSFQQPTMRSI